MLKSDKTEAQERLEKNMIRQSHGNQGFGVEIYKSKHIDREHYFLEKIMKGQKKNQKKVLVLNAAKSKVRALALNCIVFRPYVC